MKLRKKRQLKQNKDLIKNSILKIVIFSMIVGLNWTGLSAVIETIAYYNDIEQSPVNNYTASTLDFSLRSGQTNFVPLEKALNMKPGDTVARDIYIKKEGDLPFKYTAISKPVEGLCDLKLYDALQLKIWYNWYDATPTEPNYHEHRHMALKYDGLLKDFNLRALNPDDPDLQIPNSHPYFENVFYGPDEHWFYASQIILPAAVSAELQNKTCQFKFVFNGWQINLGDNSSGFTDTEEILSTIATGDWMPDVTVIYPNGEEVWYLVPDSCPSTPWCSLWCQAHGMNADCQYPLQWTATNKIGPDMDLLIDIYFSADGGTNWMAQIVNDTNNDGIFEWKIPYNMSYVTSHGRIKVEATHKDYSFLTDWDMSDADFCPPLLTLEDLLNWEEPPVEEEPITEEEPAPEESIEEAVDEVVGEEPIVEETPITEEEPIVGEEPPEEISVVEEESIEEEVTPVPSIEDGATGQATEENQEGGIIEEINGIIDEVIDEIVNEIMPEEETGDEAVSEPEVPVIEDVPIIEEVPADEAPAVEEQPANEEQPVIAPPENNFVEQAPSADNSDSGEEGESETQ